jgi:hypothetical protein
MRDDQPNLLMKINSTQHLAFIMGGLEAEIDLFRLRLFHEVGNSLGVRKQKKKIIFGGPVAPPGSAWRPNKLFLLVGKPWDTLDTRSGGMA